MIWGYHYFRKHPNHQIQFNCWRLVDRNFSEASIFSKRKILVSKGGVSFHSKPSRFLTILSNSWNLWSNPTALSLRILTAQKCLIWRIQTPAILRFKPLQGARILRDGVILHNDSKTVFLMAKPDFFHEFYYPQTNPWHGGSPVLMNEWLHLKINGNILASMIVCTNIDSLNLAQHLTIDAWKLVGTVNKDIVQMHRWMHYGSTRYIIFDQYIPEN